MPPRRRETDKHLPQRVYLKHGAYYYCVPPDANGKQKWIKLGKTESEMLRALADLKGESKPSQQSVFFQLCQRYRQDVIPTKAPRTQKDNLVELANLEKSFGKIDNLASIKPIHIYQYLDARAKIAKTRANREISLLSHVFSFAVRWGMIESNPCRDVRKNPEKSRDRYVTDAEYQAVYNLAPPMLQAAMEITSITGMRQADIINLKRQNITTEGVEVTQRKTGKKQIFLWTSALRQAIDKALALQTINSFYIFATSNGRHYTSSGFQTAWQRLMNKCMEEGILTQRYTFHDLRAKAGSESDDAQKLLGHQSPSTTIKIYRRKPEKTTPNR